MLEQAHSVQLSFYTTPNKGIRFECLDDLSLLYYSYRGTQESFGHVISTQLLSLHTEDHFSYPQSWPFPMKTNHKKTDYFTQTQHTLLKNCPRAIIFVDKESNQ
eukprot:GAHX01001526.1.p1 GENE.GAHX01001526.1~~GAHX01001526.1.p1  ORF type:complete len:104 (+),score=10.42 GAHX01001526.1:151-462(+)